MAGGKLKILAASDTHGDSKTMLSLAKRAEKEKADLVVLCGDILGFQETKKLISPFKERNKNVLILPGNWDSFADIDFMAELYKIRNLHGYSAIYKGVGFFGAGGADAPGPGRISSEKELFDTLSRAHSSLKGIEKKIMITHMHPANTKAELSGIPGSEAIFKAIKEFKPDLVIHGHIHETAGMETLIGKTRVINTGKNGTIVEI